MSAAAAIFDPARRAPREHHRLDRSSGIYALFLTADAALTGLDIPGRSLIYIGKADGAGGLRSRCHFKGETRNHSPRKSLAALLRKHLSLAPVPVRNARDGTYKSWQLEPESERRLDAWMHANLELATLATPNARDWEVELIRAHAPPR